MSLVHTGSWVLIALALFAAGAAAAESAAPVVTAEDYARAERFLPWNADKYVLNGEVSYGWLDQGDQLWYRRQTRTGKEFILVDAARGTRRPAFDHAWLARALTAATGTQIIGTALPFDELTFTHDRRALEVTIEGQRWRCILREKCAQVPRARRGELVSPDGKWAAYVKDYDIWIRSLADDSVRALTHDGVERLAYGQIAGSSGNRLDLQFRGEWPAPPVALWSSDSTKLLIERLDERGVLDFHFLQHAPEDGSVRPRHISYPAALPGDENVATAQLVVMHVADGRQVSMQHPPLPVLGASPIGESRAWWGAAGDRIYFMPREEGERTLSLLSMDVVTGAVTPLVRETSETFIDASAAAVGNSGGPKLWILRDGSILWYSQRSDWRHIYMYDRRGTLAGPITSGEWNVHDVVHVDEAARHVYFTGRGREPGEDPYQRHLYRADLGGGNLRLLTPENAEHEVRVSSFAPSGRYFVDAYSRPDLAPVTVLRSRGGRIVIELERADLTALQAESFNFPEPFSALAADGQTRIYGNLFRPGRFDPQRRYPVVEILYPGPQVIMTKKSFMDAVFSRTRAMSSQSLAELGFVLVTIDGRGTPLRSKSFHDLSYGRMQDASDLRDHIAAIHELARRYPYIDATRVGIYGNSSGGYGTVRAMLTHPDFYKVGVASNGDYDRRGQVRSWGPTYQGPLPSRAWDLQSALPLAGNLRGKLLLVASDLDDNVHPALTLQLADALIKANKDFDLMMLPNLGHEVDATSRYFIRRRWDYFVQHLLGAQPPEGYDIEPPRARAAQPH